MSERQPLSAVILTRDAEKHIRRCLKYLTWADEILVVDGGSQDRTLALLRAADAPWADRIRVQERAWTGFRDQRNHAMAEARHDWLLVVDADEECTPELRERLQGLLARAGGPPSKAYKVRRVEYFLGKPILFGIWNPSYQDRFFHRAGVKYVNEVHEYPIFPAPAELLHEALLHSPDFAPDKFLDKMNRYTSIEARDRVAAGQRTNVFRVGMAFPAMFLKNYFYYSAWKDGMHGFVISILEGISRAVRHVKMWQYGREIGQHGRPSGQDAQRGSPSGQVKR